VNITSISADEHTVAGRYLAGQLSDEECAAFEERLREDPAVVREVEATARLKVGLGRLRERSELDALLAPPRWYQPGLLLATAASVAIVALGVVMVGRSRVDVQRPVLAASIGALVDTQGSALPVIATLAVFRKRAETYDAIIESAPSAGAVELRVLPETTVASRRYRVDLSRLADDGSLTAVASLDNLRPADDGFVTMLMDRSQLAAGRYRLDVLGKVGDGSVRVSDTFLIRVVPSKGY
jgi:hypothetical protein